MRCGMNSPAKDDTHAMTCVIASVSYSSPDRCASKDEFNRATRCGHAPAAYRPTETPKLVKANFTECTPGSRHK